MTIIVTDSVTTEEEFTDYLMDNGYDDYPEEFYSNLFKYLLNSEDIFVEFYPDDIPHRVAKIEYESEEDFCYARDNGVVDRTILAVDANKLCIWAIRKV